MNKRYISILILICLLLITGDILNAQTAVDTLIQTMTQQQTQVTDTTDQSSALARAGKTPEWSITFGKVFWSIIIFIIGFLLIKYLTNFLVTLGERWTKTRLLIKGIIPIFRILGWMVVGYIIIVDVFAPPIATLVAVTASAGIAVGFAAQDILKNIFGGVVILLDHPFQVGDKIEIGDHYGEVLSIGLRTVRVVTPDDSVVAIPNSEIVNTAVSNANSGESNCQVVAEFYLPAHIDIPTTRKIAYRAAAVSKYVYLNKPIIVIFKNEIYEGRSLLKMRLKAYVFDIRFEFPFASEMTELVVKELLARKLVTINDLNGLPMVKLST
ncbi:mechanosensitive ion channel [candidate division KSB1 bacterium]|nr:mechanosensitive ion channel [candidate division KSB1 bacterium]